MTDGSGAKRRYPGMGKGLIEANVTPRRNDSINPSPTPGYLNGDHLPGLSSPSYAAREGWESEGPTHTVGKVFSRSTTLALSATTRNLPLRFCGLLNLKTFLPAVVGQKAHVSSRSSRRQPRRSP